MTIFVGLQLANCYFPLRFSVFIHFLMELGWWDFGGVIPSLLIRGRLMVKIIKRLTLII